MSIPIKPLLCKMVMLAVALYACAPAGEVVKVERVPTGTYAGLNDEDRAKLEELRQLSARKGIDRNLSNVIQKTPHFAVSDYLLKYPEAGDQSAKNYRVGGYDVLNVMVYEEKDLSREALPVSADGYISFPLIGRLQVENLTTSEIEKLIATRLAEGQYLLDAHVAVMVMEYKSKRVLILGAIGNPASYALQARERVLDLISRAGGIRRAGEGGGGAGSKGLIIRTAQADTPTEQKIVITLDLKGLLEDGDQVSNIFMQDKDVLYIPSAEQFYIIGQVQSPGAYTLTDREITLVEAISKAGGFTSIAARNRTRIVRVEDGVEKIITVQVDAITDAGKKIQDVIVRPNDVIVVPESFF